MIKLIRQGINMQINLNHHCLFRSKLTFLPFRCEKHLNSSGLLLHKQIMENLSKRKLVTNDIIKTPEVMGHVNKYSLLVSSESEVHIFIKSTADKTELFPVLRAR